VTGAGKRYRVVVVGVARGSTRSPQQLADDLAARFPLPADARLAIEAGRSAVVQTGATEAHAHRAATLIIKLGAEVHIEPDEGSAPASGGQGYPHGAGGMDYGSVNLPPDDDGLPPLAASREDPTKPVLADRPAPLIVDRPPAGAPPPPSVSPAPRSTPPRNVSAQLPAITEEPAPSGASGPGDESAAVEPGAVRTVGGSGSNPKIRLVRCPAHGLLYDANQSPGCSRCLGLETDPRIRLAPTLHRRPRIWLAAGMLIALLLGAVPAVIYAHSVKTGPLLERRIEAENIRLGKTTVPEVQAAYADARARVDRVRSRGVAFSALLWLGVSALVLLLWYRFV